ncbi:MAG: MFS transporter, partial [Clostridia bacterium]|nr:MFS transporter [Clostridia bacterium]
ESNYFIDVFGSYSLITLANLPSSLNGSISYAFVSPLRKRFSSKALWVGADIYGDILSAAYFVFGMIGRNYTKMIPMVVAVGIREWFTKWAFGVNKVINADLWNEAMDYCEWKNGYRMEATTGVAKSLVLKIQSSLMGSARNLILKEIGYVQGLAIGTQDTRTKFWLFALCSIVPTISGALGIIPKFLWPLTKEKRAKMYADLAKRRKELVENA